MQKTFFDTMAAPVRLTLMILAGLFVLAGCGSDEEKKEKDEDDKKPAYERVVILKERFDQLENSLDEMERDLQLQKKRIEGTRETAKSIKRSLMKGNLKGYSLSTVTTDPVVLQAIQKQKDKDREEEAEEAEKEQEDDWILNSLLIIIFVIFLIIIFAVALKDRNQPSPYEAARSPYPKPEPEDTGTTEPTGESGPENTGSSFEYGRPNDLLPGGGDETPPANPPGEAPGDEEPKQ